MAEIRNIDLGAILGTAEGIKSQRQANVAAEQQNRLNAILTPMRVQQAQLEQEQANQQQLMNESKVFLDVLGDTSGMDEAQAQNAWANARANHARLFGEEDAAQIPELFDPQSLQQMQGLVSSGIGGQSSKFQFGASNLIRGEDGNLYQVSQRRDPRTGKVDTVMSAVSGELVDKLGLTAQGKVDQTRAEAEAREQGKITAEISSTEALADSKATIERRKQEAIAQAKGRGETLSELDQARAALPALQENIEKLKDLAPLVTSTVGGKLFNSAVKELGFGATEGATARAKYIAIIDNQVLPLLKPTFGAAFTEGEGERLRATLGDPDASPQEKIAQLDAFIAQKIQDIETKERAAGISPQPVQPSAEVPSSLDEAKRARLQELRAKFNTGG